MNVSIIVPVYNGGKVLDLTIPSLLKQDYLKGKIEIIMIFYTILKYFNLSLSN